MTTDATPERPRKSLLPATSGLAQLGGAGVVLAGLIAMVGDVPKVLAVLMLLAGAAVVALGSLARKNKRVAWAFLCSTYGTLSVAFLFGGPKIDEWFQRGMFIAYVPAILCVVMTGLLIACRDEF